MLSVTHPAPDGTVRLQWSYRIPFALQWVLPPFLIALIAFAPESPWWLVRKGRLSDAQSSVVRLGGFANSDPANTIAMMVRTTELEAQTTAGASYVDCFKGTDLRRTM
jgi:SP family general alpha glucoside:H+ symporter-like MFS transporter